MRILKISLKIIAVVLLLVVVALALMLAPVNDTPYQQMGYYKQWKASIGHTSKTKSADSHAPQPFKIGWAKVNFTPAVPTPMAGYGVRRGAHYTSVRDSIFVRAVVIDNGRSRVAVVSADLLIVPPAVTEQLKTKLPSTGIAFEQVYLGATHSHNSMGGWSSGLVGELFGGKFNPKNVDWIADAIVKAVYLAQKDLQVATLTYQESADTARVYNRLFEEGTTDPWLRMLRFERQDQKRALLCSFAAHSTILSSDNMALSRDYPGVLIDSLERGEADFAMFMAGAVGSMGPKIEGKTDVTQMIAQADSLEGDVQAQLTQASTRQSTPKLQLLTLNLPLREPNPRVTLGWRLRPWVFYKVFGDFPSHIKALRLGNVLMVGVPCDFSGELMADLTQYAKRNGLELMVTSFNGGYIGYVTPDKYYGRDTYETLTMNWFGPSNGAYFQEMIRDLIDKMK